MEEIPDDVLDRPITGVGVAPGELRNTLGSEPTLLVFLRHFGCIFCKETISDLRLASEANPAFPPVLFFFQGNPSAGRAFLRNYWPSARAVSDPDLWFYDAFGVRQARFLEAFGPKVFVAQRRARAKGHRNGGASGDIWRMPGVFLAAGPRILWSFEPKHAADHPDFAAVPSHVT